MNPVCNLSAECDPVENPVEVLLICPSTCYLLKVE